MPCNALYPSWRFALLLSKSCHSLLGALALPCCFSKRDLCVRLGALPLCSRNHALYVYALGLAALKACPSLPGSRCLPALEIMPFTSWHSALLLSTRCPSFLGALPCCFRHRALYVSQSCDFPLRVLYTCTSKLRSSSQSWKLVLHVLYLHYKVVTFQLVLETCTLRALDLHFKVASLQLELVLQSCDFPAGALKIMPFTSWRFGFALLLFKTRPICTSWRFASLLSKPCPVRLCAWPCCSESMPFTSWLSLPSCARNHAFYVLALCLAALDTMPFISWRFALLLSTSCSTSHKVAIFHFAYYTLALQSCDLPARAGNSYFTYYTCTTKL